MQIAALIFLIIYCLWMIPLSMQSQPSTTTTIPSSTSSTNIYAATNANMLSPIVAKALYRVYVPNGNEGTVSVIDPTTYQVVDTFRTGKNPQHVVPSYDLQTLWVLNDRGNSLTPIDPTTAKPKPNVTVDDPYNLYFTPDGQFAIVVCEARKQLQFRDPQTMKLHDAIKVNCRGVNHMEFTADKHFAIITCEFSGELVKIDLVKHQVVGYLSLLPVASPISDNKHNKIKLTPINTQVVQPLQLSMKGQTFTLDGKELIINDGNTVVGNIQKQSAEIKQEHHQHQHMLQSMPQDIRSTADGRIFIVADMMKDGVIMIDPISFTQIGFIPTGIGTHGIYPSRDGMVFYVSNRGCHHVNCGPHGPGSVSVVSVKERKVIATWPIPNGGSPDMGNVSPDGKELWLSGRYDNEVYVFDTTTGILTHRIPVGKGPHGLAVWPQPGQYSLGHTGNMR